MRAGFVIVIACLAFSAFYAYRLQTSLTEETRGIYHRHMEQGNLLYQVRRTIWLGSMAGRDYMIDPTPQSAVRLKKVIEPLRAESFQHIEELARSGSDASVVVPLREAMEDFWEMVAAIPVASRGLSPPQRFEFIRNEIVPRRNVAGQLVRDLSEIGAKWLKESEYDFTRARRNSARHLLLILGLAIACSAVTAGFAIAHTESLERKTSEQYAEVERARIELRDLSARLLEIQEQERTRLSRELHDEIGQLIATLRLEIARSESLPPEKYPEIRERLVRARQLAEKTLQTVRNICLMLRPTLLDDLGLEPALEWQVEDFTRRTGIVCHLSTSDLTDDLPDSIRTCVYRVLQESLHNCEKHAAATEVSVTIHQKPEALTLIVEDNGVGFDAAAATQSHGGHFGLIGMRERATNLKGEFEIQSFKGAGARISMSLPLAGVKV